MDNQKQFTLGQLRQFHGDHAPAYIAYNGIVYDVSNSHRWKNGHHELLHWAGLNLTDELGNAPHFDEVFKRPSIFAVGVLIDDECV